VARSTEFRGYGPATLAATGLFAAAAGAVQALWLPDPANRAVAYLAIWISTAIVSAALIGTQMRARTHRVHSGLANEMILMAVEQFLPAAAAGALLTFAIMRFVPGVVWILPGLLQIVFSLGVFSSCRFLPRPMLAAGAWYLATGIVCISLAGNRALSPWAMAVPYGVGQFLVAGILFFTTREADDEK
jgi:hypothetical protein